MTTSARPPMDQTDSGSPRSHAPSHAAVIGLNARKTVTSVGDAWLNAHNQSTYPMPLPTPMNPRASQPPAVNRGSEAKNPSGTASTARNATEASIANALTGNVAYRAR